MNEQQIQFKAEVDDALEEAGPVLTLGENTRRILRRKTRPGSQPRQQRLEFVIDEITRIMGPIRSLVGTMQWRESWSFAALDERRLREASKALQAEQHQLRMMLR